MHQELKLLLNNIMLTPQYLTAVFIFMSLEECTQMHVTSGAHRGSFTETLLYR